MKGLSIEEISTKTNQSPILMSYSNQTLHFLVVFFVRDIEFDSTSKYLVYSVVDSNGTSNGLYYRDLEEAPSEQQEIATEEDGLFTNLSWNNQDQWLAFTAAALDTTFETRNADLGMPLKIKQIS